MRTSRPASPRAASSPGPLSRREAAVGLVRGQDPGRPRARPAEPWRPSPADRGRARAHPRRGRRPDRERGHRRHADRARGDGRGRLDLARPLPLRDPRGAPRAGARVLVRAAPATCASGEGEGEVASHAERLAAMIDQCLPYPGLLERDWMLWVELWLRAVRHPELRPTAARLYARMREWLAEAIAAGIEGGELRASRPRARGRPAAGAGGRLRRAGPDRRARHRARAGARCGRGSRASSDCRGGAAAARPSARSGQEVHEVAEGHRRPARAGLTGVSAGASLLKGGRGARARGRPGRLRRRQRQRGLEGGHREARSRRRSTATSSTSTGPSTSTRRWSRSSRSGTG